MYVYVNFARITISISMYMYHHPILHTHPLSNCRYQGESNSGADGRKYECAMKALIFDWRHKWHNRTRHNGTDAEFPFGLVQLNSNGGPSKLGTNPVNTPGAGGDDPYGAWHSGFTGVRWAQTQALRSTNRTFQVAVVGVDIDTV